MSDSSLEQSRTKLAGEADLVQMKAFTKWINSHLEKAGLEVTDLFQDLRDGSKLLTLLELFTGKKMPREKGKMRVHHIQNVKTAINYLTDVRKIRIVGIPNEEIVDGNRKLTLGLVWMLILNFELSGALPTEPGEPGQRPKSPKEVSAKEVKTKLLNWAKEATEGYEEVSISNFHKSWNDGMAFCAIINRHRPDLLDYDEECDPSKPLENLERAFSVAEKELGVIRFLDPEDVNVEKPSEEAILIYVAALRQVFPEMPPPHRRKGPPVSVEDYRAQYSSLQDWINARRQLVSNRDFPRSVNEVRQLLNEFSSQRLAEDPVKENERQELRAMEAELRVFAMKRRKELDIPDMKHLDESWLAAMTESDQYQQALQSLLDKLIKRDQLLSEISSDIQTAAASLDTLEKETNDLEAVAMETDQMTGKVVEISNGIKAVQVIIAKVKKSLSSLKDTSAAAAGDIDTDPLDQQVSALESRISLLLSRLEQFQSSFDGAQLLLTEADMKLKECEKWLVLNGKFADNQLILDQIREYESFKANQFAEAANVMDKVNSTPLVGMEEKVEDLNKRWNSIQEQINNRLSKFQSISATVNEFESIKTPLEEWCISQQELFHHLPLLETTLADLNRQREQFESILNDVLSHQEHVEEMERLSDRFSQDREPVQSSADKFTRRLKRLSSEFNVVISSRKDPSEEAMDMSLYEQSGVLKDQWERYKSQIELRVQQASDLAERLAQFEELHTSLRQLIDEGRSLLDSERPVGDSAERITEQTNTCQVFRQRLTDAQPTVDKMLALGRSIIGEHYTNPHHDSLSLVLTDFIQDWSNLLLSWQNWFDELHATGEQSQNLSEQFGKLKQFISTVTPEYRDLFPATIGVDCMNTDLKELQDTFTRTVYDPLMSLKPTYSSLSANAHLLSNKDEVENVLKEFTALTEKFESQALELSSVIDNVNCWWAEFETIRSKIAEMREELTEALPLGGSVPVVMRQDEQVQAVLLEVEEKRPKFQRCLRNLTSVAGHTNLLVPKPILQCRDELQTDWDQLYEQAEQRRDIVEIGRVRLNVYIECRDPFDSWLEQAELKLSSWQRVDVGGKDVLVEQTESLKAFRTDVELHSHDLQSCSTLADKFLDTAKSHQGLLLSYKHKLHPPHTHSQILPEGFYDWDEGEGLKGVSPSDGNLFQCQEYRNGLLVVRSDLLNETKRYHRLKGRVARRTQRYEEAREKRLACEEALEAILPKLKGAESLVDSIKQSGLGKNSVKSLREQLEMMESLESEFSELRTLMDPLHMSVAAWSVREPIDSEAEGEEEGGAQQGDDECVKEKERVQERYENVQENLRLLREELESSLAEAQAFQSAYSSFVSWLRDTERKIQRDNRLKLEVNDLKSGLAYLKAVSADISGHEEVYSDLCGRFHAILEIMKGEEKQETEEKLENLVTRWAGLQVIHEDIEVISEIIPQLEAFYVKHRLLLLEANALLEKLTDYSPSTNSTEGAEKKREELQVLINDYTSLQSQFEELLMESSSLIETLFDQKRFESDVTALREKLNECKVTKDEKNKSLKHITSRLKTLEVSWLELETWLASSEEKIETLNSSLNRSGAASMTEQLRQIQQLDEEYTEHEGPLDSIESLISSLSSYLEELHSTELESRFKSLNSRYRLLGFSTQAYPLEAWLQMRFSELYLMHRAAILTLPLTTQFHEATRFQHQLEAHRPRMTELEGVVSALPDQSDLSPAKIKMEFVLKEYETLKSLAGRRAAMLNSFLPRVKLYEGSLENWERLLTGWEESAAAMATPTATPALVQSQIEAIKSFQLELSNHEPEFSALLREALQLYSGPDGESELSDDLKGVSASVSPLPPDETRQGQTELQGRLDEDKLRLENLKRSFSDRLSLLSSLFQNMAQFTETFNQLSPWLQEQTASAAELVIREPAYKVLQEKLATCQALRNHMSQKSAQKDELVSLYHSISSAVSSDDTASLALKNQLDELQQTWSSLSDQLATAQSSLEPAAKLSRSYERERERQAGWIKTALEELTGLGPIPSEPDAVQELKIRIDNLKAEYNSLAPMLAQCVEEGLELSGYVQDPTHKDQLKGAVEELQSGWDSVGRLLGDIHQKLTDALMQTQEFQQVADNLERWVNATQTSLRCQEPVAACVRLIEPQIEGFKPILEDIKLNYDTLEQAKTIGMRVAAESTAEEKMKMEKRLHALETRFYGLDKAGKARMSELKDAHTKAGIYEGRCSGLSDWLKTMEDKMASFPATPIRSQPLKTLHQDIKGFNQLVEIQEPVVQEMSASECTLFATDMQIISRYDDQEDLPLLIASTSPRRRAQSPLPPNPTLGDMPIHPDFVKRPGAVEAMESGSKLRKRYEKLKLEVDSRADEASQLLQLVLNYETNFGSFTDWLNEMCAKLEEQGTLSTSSDTLKEQLKELEDLQSQVNDKQLTLESINATGTSLIDGCRDDLSRDSTRESLTGLNEKWGDLLSSLDSRAAQLKEAIKLSEKYEGREREFTQWLTGCEDKLMAKPATGGLEQTLQNLRDIQSDISIKKPLLDSTVTMGQSLESFITSSGSGATPTPLLTYPNLQRRYGNLSSQLEERQREIEGSISKASGIKSQMMSLCEQLKVIKTSLENHEPPRLIPDLIKQQIQELQIVSSQWTSLQPSVQSVLESAQEYSTIGESDIASLANELSSCNKSIRTLLDSWGSRLQGVLDSANQFETDHREMNSWMGGVHSKLGREEAVRGTVEGVKVQIEDMESTNSDIGQHQQPLQELMNLGRGMMGGASPNDCILVGDRLAQTQASMETIQRHAFGRMRVLKEGLTTAEDFSQYHQNTLTALRTKASDLSMLPSVGTDVETVTAQLEDFKDFEEEIQQLKPQLTTCTAKGKQLKEACHHDDHAWVDARLEELNAAWSGLQSSCTGRQQLLENALLRLGQFHEALAELLSWIDEGTRTLEDKGNQPGVTVETLETQLKEVQALQSEIVTREPTVSSLNEAGNKLIATGTDETNAAEIQADINGLNEKWGSIKNLTADRHLKLSTGLERARGFHGNWKGVVDKLNKLEEEAIQDWTPPGLPQTCQDAIELHKVFVQQVQGLKGAISDLKGEGEGLKQQASDIDRNMVDRWISDLEERWEEVIVATEDKQLQLDEAKMKADQFDASFNDLSDQLNQLKKQADEESTILSEAEAVKGQLEKHNEFLKKLDEFSNHLKQVEVTGLTLAKECVSEDGEIIRDKLQELKSRADSVQADALSQLSKLEEALLTLGEFEETYSELKSWLAKMWDQLQAPDPIIGQSEHIANQLARNKVTQRELDARATSYKSVMKAGKELMKSKQGTDKNNLKRKLTDLEQEWQGVCQMCVARQQKLDGALKKVQLLESQIQPLSSWMTKVLSSLDDSEPVHGDVATVHELTDAHEAFQRELGAYQKSIDSIQVTTGQLETDVLDNASPIREEVEELVACWKEICDLSLKKQERLEQAMKVAMEFNEGVHELWNWMDERGYELDQMEAPADEVELLQQQTEELEQFKSLVHAKQPQYEHIIDAGTNLHQLAHPRAEPLLQGQLDQLHQKWKGLKAKIGSRSEALTSNMLELHGLQDMLDQLSEWVQEAEDSMGGAEGVPVGDDLESVEKQLTEHESFQEEMATLQPNMDALNKAAKRRKSRVSLNPTSASHPDMTKRIGHLYKRWQKLWLRSSERHRQLLEARTRLKDIALARSFNFEAWCKRFVSWIDQQKLRVSDLFRRFDANHDGMLTREEFMKGLKASGLAMNQIEMEKIADTFDRNKNGLIDLSEIMAILKGQTPRRKFVTSAGPARALSDADKIDMEIKEQVSKCHCLHKFQVVRVGEGQYRFGDSQKLRLVRILRSTVMVRVGGGWEPLPEFLSKNDPCRTSGRTNAELRDLLNSDQPVYGLASAEFRRKSQTAISAKNEALRRASAKEPDTLKTTRATPHSGRQETVVTKRAASVAKVDTGLKRNTRSHSAAAAVSYPSSVQKHVHTSPSRDSKTLTKTPPTQSSPERHSASNEGTPTEKSFPVRGPTPTGATPITVTPSTPTRPSSKIPLPSGTASKIPISKIPTPSKGKAPRR